MNKKLAILFLVCFLFLSFPHVTDAAIQLVICGTQKDPNTGVITNPCKFTDLVILLVRVINYLMGVAAIVAMYYLLLSGFNLITSLGNPEKIEKAKTGISNAVVGFGMVILSFVFVNLLVNSLFGETGSARPWWNPVCVFDITKSRPECPLGPGSF